MSASNVICESTGGYDLGMNAGAGMRIAYVLQWEGGLESGVMKKVRGQIEEWRRLGAHCHAFVLTAKGSVLDRDVIHDNAAWLSLFPYRGMLGRLSAGNRMSRGIEQWKPALFYGRGMAFHPSLWRVARQVPSCLEINSDSRRERGGGLSLASVYRASTMRLHLGAFDGFVFVTQELERVVGTLAQARKTIVIPNGIRLAREERGTTNTKERALFFIGSPGQRWHGVDRVLQLAAALSDWRFDIVGYDGPEVPDRREAGPNVRFHGFLGRPDYQALIERAVAGIGSVALDRIGLNEACPLKVREYLANGLPAIIGFQDPDFPEGAPFLFRVQGEVSNWAIDGLREFLNWWMSKTVSREAIAHLDTAVKEARRLDFLIKLSTPRAHANPNTQA